MKTFLKLDFYLQTTVFFATIIVLKILSIKEDDMEPFFWFYWVVGGSQLISFLIRVLLDYPKSIFFHIYGIAILPIWFGFASALVDFQPGMILIIFAYLGLFYAPFLSIFYLIYSYETYKIYPKPTFQKSHGATL